MSATPAALSRTEFTRLVRDALNRMYDSAYLEAHPLCRLLIPAESTQVRASQELRRVLLAAIQSMHPGKSAPNQSHDWRGYRILEMRYITGLSAGEVMQRISLGRSLFFLEQARALEALVDRLWTQAEAARLIPPHAQSQAGVQRQPASQEIERLLKETAWEALDLSELLEKLQPMISALVHAQGGELAYAVHRPAGLAHANRVLLRQVILSLISHGLESYPGGEVSIRQEESEEAGVVLRVSRRQTSGENPASAEAPGQGMSLELCQRCLQAMEGTLQLEEQGEFSWQARLAWYPAGPRRLLVIDDHPDFIDLVRRFLGGLDWQVFGAGDGETARQVMGASRPDAILLDVILPGEDGWDLLLSIKTDEAARRIPVIVCSALNEPGLVAALGGTAFLPKPLTRQALLEALEKSVPADPILGSGLPGPVPAPG